jgi:hypothetical protein
MLDAPHLGIHRENQPIIPATIAQAFHDQHGGQDVGSTAAIFFWNSQTEDAHFGALLPILVRELALAVAIDQSLIEFLLSKLDYGLFVSQLFFRPGKIHTINL